MTNITREELFRIYSEILEEMRREYPKHVHAFTEALDRVDLETAKEEYKKIIDFLISIGERYAKTRFFDIRVKYDRQIEELFEQYGNDVEKLKIMLTRTLQEVMNDLNMRMRQILGIP